MPSPRDRVSTRRRSSLAYGLYEPKAGIYGSPSPTSPLAQQQQASSAPDLAPAQIHIPHLPIQQNHPYQHQHQQPQQQQQQQQQFYHSDTHAHAHAHPPHAHTPQNMVYGNDIYNPSTTPGPPPSSAGLSNVQFAPNVTQETFTTGSDDEDDDMMLEYGAGPSGSGGGGDMSYDGYGEGTSPQSTGSGSGDPLGGDVALSPPSSAGVNGKQKIIPQAKLFPPSTTPAPPPTRKRCPPGKRRSMGYIPRPANAFMLFRADFVRQKHVPGSVEASHGSLSRIIGTCWRQLPLEEKKVWEIRAKHAKAEHKQRYPEYRFRPVHNKNKTKGPGAGAGPSGVGLGSSGMNGHVRNESGGGSQSGHTDTLEEERRVEDVASLLLSGKKGDELARAVREMDRKREEEKRARLHAERERILQMGGLGAAGMSGAMGAMNIGGQMEGQGQVQHPSFMRNGPLAPVVLPQIPPMPMPMHAMQGQGQHREIHHHHRPQRAQEMEQHHQQQQRGRSQNKHHHKAHRRSSSVPLLDSFGSHTFDGYDGSFPHPQHPSQHPQAHAHAHAQNQGHHQHPHPHPHPQHQQLPQHHRQQQHPLHQQQHPLHQGHHPHPHPQHAGMHQHHNPHHNHQQHQQFMPQPPQMMHMHFGSASSRASFAFASGPGGGIAGGGADGGAANPNPNTGPLPGVGVNADAAALQAQGGEGGGDGISIPQLPNLLQLPLQVPMPRASFSLRASLSGQGSYAQHHHHGHHPHPPHLSHPQPHHVNVHPSAHPHGHGHPVPPNVNVSAGDIPPNDNASANAVHPSAEERMFLGHRRASSAQLLPQYQHQFARDFEWGNLPLDVQAQMFSPDPYGGYDAFGPAGAGFDMEGVEMNNQEDEEAPMELPEPNTSLFESSFLEASPFSAGPSSTSIASTLTVHANNNNANELTPIKAEFSLSPPPPSAGAMSVSFDVGVAPHEQVGVGGDLDLTPMLGGGIALPTLGGGTTSGGAIAPMESVDPLTTPTMGHTSVGGGRTTSPLTTPPMSAGMGGVVEEGWPAGEHAQAQAQGWDQRSYPLQDGKYVDPPAPYVPAHAHTHAHVQGHGGPFVDFRMGLEHDAARQMQMQMQMAQEEGYYQGGAGGGETRGGEYEHQHQQGGYEHGPGEGYYRGHAVGA